MKDRLIALLTDFDLKDSYVGVMKGVINYINPRARVVDVTHGVTPQDVIQGAFILEKTFAYFPANTIFVAVIDPGVGSSRKALAVQTDRCFFIAPDNGLISPALEKMKIVRMVEIKTPDYILYPPSNTFHGRDIFAPAAAHLSTGLSIEKLGPVVDDYQKLEIFHPEIEGKLIRGKVIFADHFGNLITNVNAKLLRGREIKKIVIDRYEIDGITQFYQESQGRELMGIIGSYDTLEISISMGSAREFVGPPVNREVEVHLAPPE